MKSGGNDVEPGERGEKSGAVKLNRAAESTSGKKPNRATAGRYLVPLYALEALV